jgi:molybdopterin-containing oxidoreductase family membrane subunit
MTITYHPFNKNENIILDPMLRRITARDLMVWGLLLIMFGVGVYAYLTQWFSGLGETGLGRPVYWGLYITNFVFFIGLAHSGTFISAILRLAGAGWRKPLTRAAEAITLFSLPFGVGSILIDMGRPDRVLNIIFYGRFQSPLLWDISAVSLYLFSSIVFFYLSLLPDIALCRDRLTNVPAWWQKMYKLLALGWTGRPEQFERLEKVLDGMAIFMTLLVVTVHTVVSWVFGMTVQPGWHTALIGPFFLVGAIFSGTAAVVIVLAILRKVYHMESVLPVSLFNYLRKLLIVFTVAWLYMMLAEFLTTGYGNLADEMPVLWQKLTGDFAFLFWTMGITVFVLPIIVFVFLGKNNIGWMVFACISVNIGMWIERFLVIVPTETRPRFISSLMDNFANYHPSWVEIAITIGLFSGLSLLYVTFTRFFPIVPIWETTEADVAEKLTHESQI